MDKIVAYIRVSSDKQDLSHQKLEILEYARKNKLHVSEFIEITISSRKTTKQRRIDELTQRLVTTDTLIVTELSRLGRSTAEVIDFINDLINRNIRLIIIKQNLNISKHDMNSKIMVTFLSLFAELERDITSMRTKESLAAKRAQGVKLGKPKGTLQKSKFDEHIDKIQELLKYRLSIRKIAKVLGFNNHIALNTYIKKRKLIEVDHVSNT